MTAKKAYPFSIMPNGVSGCNTGRTEEKRQGFQGKMDRINAYYKARSRLQQKLQREPEPEEICSYMSISLKELYEIEDNIHYLSQYSLEEVFFRTGW